MISDKAWEDPLFDPEGIDPYDDAIEALMARITSGDFGIGAVCEVYELCGHLLCKASYEMWVAYDLTQRALNKKMEE